MYLLFPLNRKYNILKDCHYYKMYMILVCWPRKLLLNEYNTDDPWSGIWKHENNDNEEIYKIKQIGDNKLRGWIKSNEFCDINGSLNNINKTESEIMLFWHKGPRKNKRRLCKCILNKGMPISMSVKWKSIATSSIVDGI
eukprot:447954_1